MKITNKTVGYWIIAIIAFLLAVYPFIHYFWEDGKFLSDKDMGLWRTMGLVVWIGVGFWVLLSLLDDSIYFKYTINIPWKKDSCLFELYSEYGRALMAGDNTRAEILYNKIEEYEKAKSN